MLLAVGMGIAKIVDRWSENEGVLASWAQIIGRACQKTKSDSQKIGLDGLTLALDGQKIVLDGQKVDMDCQKVARNTILEAYMSVLHGPAKVFKQVAPHRNSQKLS